MDEFYCGVPNAAIRNQRTGREKNVRAYFVLMWGFNAELERRGLGDKGGECYEMLGMCTTHDRSPLKVTQTITYTVARRMHGLLPIVQSNYNNKATLPAQLPRILESKVTSDGTPKATGARRINPRNHSGRIDPMDKFLGLGSPCRNLPILP